MGNGGGGGGGHSQAYVNQQLHIQSQTLYAEQQRKEAEYQKQIA
jgi:hypothetical protein